MDQRRGGLRLGCTVGVVRRPGGILFFKNRDLSGRYTSRRTIVTDSTPETQALRGVDLETGQPVGVSIEVNRDRVCVANTHIISSPDLTYDMLCERLLQGVRQPEDVPRVVDAFMAEHRVQGGRILVGGPEWAYLVEVYQDQWLMEQVVGDLAITNRFTLLPFRAQRPEVRDESSFTRLQTALQAMEAITKVQTLKALLRSHTPAKGDLSICNHRDDGGGTESSHIVQVWGGSVVWWSLSGFPCENDYSPAVLFQ